MESDNLHHELLDNAGERFPIESFLEMRRTGLDTSEVLTLLNVRETELSFQIRAVLAVDPNDRDTLAGLIGYSV